LAVAQHLYWAYADYDRAQEDLAAARHTLPNESRIPLMSGYIYRRQGRWEKSIEEMNKALELDPHNFPNTPSKSLLLTKRFNVSPRSVQVCTREI
jgi:tetratricopeptide (TPR) repeat protein